MAEKHYRVGEFRVVVEERRIPVPLEGMNQRAWGVLRVYREAEDFDGRPYWEMKKHLDPIESMHTLLLQLLEEREDRTDG